MRKKTVQCCGKEIEYREMCPTCRKVRYPLPDLKDPIEVVLLSAIAGLLLFIALSSFLIPLMSRFMHH